MTKIYSKIYEKVYEKVYNKIQDAGSSVGDGGVPPCFSDLLTWFAGYTYDDIYRLDSATSTDIYPIKMVGGPCITLNGTTDKLTYAGHGSIVSYEGTSTLSYDGTDITGTAGTAYNIVFSDGSILPCIGKTSTLNPTSTFDVDGNEATITSSDYVAIWAGSQDTYFYEAIYGYWDDVSGRYPYAHSGAIFHAGNHWNNSMSGYEFIDPVDPDIIAMDLVHLVFTDGVGNAKTFYQSTLETLNNDQYYFNTSKGLACYSDVQTEPCLGETLVYYDDANILVHNGVLVVEDNIKIYVRT